jgi:hypothetical protein
MISHSSKNLKIDNSQDYDKESNNHDQKHKRRQHMITLHEQEYQTQDVKSVALLEILGLNGQGFVHESIFFSTFCGSDLFD